MARMRRVDVRLATQVLVLQVAVVTLTLGIAGGMLAFFSHDRLAAQYENQSLDVARAIAFAPAVRADVTRYDTAPLTPSPALTDELADGQLQQLATEVQQRTGVLFVVITNDQGIRLSHPNRDELGKHVSTDPSEALAGHEVVDRESGTLGRSVRAKVPVLAPNSNRVVGEVSVGISTAAVHHQLWSDVRKARPPGRPGVDHRHRGVRASGPAVARPDAGVAALRDGRVDPRPGSRAARHRRGGARRRHRLENHVRQRRGAPAPRGRQRAGQTGGGDRFDAPRARRVQVGGFDAHARHRRRPDRRGIGTTRGARGARSGNRSRRA